jgi:hypothetical protein
MTAKYTSMIWGADLTRPMKLVALALADSADPHGVVSLENKKMFAWLTGYSVEDIDKVIAKLIESGILAPMSEMRLRFSIENIPQLVPYWRVGTAAADGDDPDAIENLRYQLKSLHIQSEMVDELVQKYPAELITAWLAVYADAVEVGLADGSGYLVSALRREWDMEAAKARIESRRKKVAKQTSAISLPDELTTLLQKLGWEDDLSEIYEYYEADPDRTLAWAIHTQKEGWGAGKFRKSLRSGLQPPNRETVLMPAIFILEDSADTSSQDEELEASPEIINAWNHCLQKIAQMTDEERGFNSGDLASWLEPAQPLNIECTGLDTSFTVKSCNTYGAEWIVAHAQATIEDVLADVLNCSVSLKSVS